MIRTYAELATFGTFEERFRYLSLRGEVGRSTFGFDRWLNQEFYRSRLWKLARREVIARDQGCDLGIPGYEIYDKVLIHHMNPIESGQILHGDESILDPEFLVCISHRTHNAVHYGDESQLINPFIERRAGDTKLWG